MSSHIYIRENIWMILQANVIGYSISPRREIVMSFISRFDSARAKAFSAMRSKPVQQGTSIWTTVMLFGLPVVMMSAIF